MPTTKPKLDPGAKLMAKIRREKAWCAEQMTKPGIFLSIRVTNPLNNRRHWRVVSSASKSARRATSAALRDRTYISPTPATVTMTRYGPRSLDEGCGLNASLKPVRDGVADFFQMDDADPAFTWVYKQERSEFFGVRVEITPIGSEVSP